ncbi:hypothetical protein [Vibrio barjaei]|uniref:hypothetical protein n=1 Tax=Vibrio barjaei TaxID=1676683 RepID=UPI00228376ED|nr:hypothetical protein [Vibrio barjaei]MCY9874051.1 hypothetical protein [Vibrio barjaei]
MQNITKQTLIEFGLTHFATASYIDKIIKEDKFCQHGSWLSDCDELFENFETKYPNASNCKKELKSLLTEWMPRRVNYIANEIIDELNHYKKLYRNLYLSKDKINSITNTKERVPVEMVGVYWSSRNDTYSFSPKQITETDKDVLLTIELETITVDWYETFVSRIDFINGDQEQEFRLLEDASINLLNLKTNEVPKHMLTN